MQQRRSFDVTDSLVARFWAKVDKAPGYGPKGECWVWTGGSRGVTAESYGAFKVRKGLTWDSHRVAYFLTHGEIPDGHLVCHECDNKRCVRPDHLKLGTYRSNRAELTERGAAPSPFTRTEPLTDAEIASIVDEHMRGISRRQLSQKYRVPPTSLALLLRKHG